jgi:hypothetical protein
LPRLSFFFCARSCLSFSTPAFGTSALNKLQDPAFAKTISDLSNRYLSSPDLLTSALLAAGMNGGGNDNPAAAAALATRLQGVVQSVTKVVVVVVIGGDLWSWCGRSRRGLVVWLLVVVDQHQQ